MPIKSTRIINLILVITVALSTSRGLAIQGRGNSRSSCHSRPSDAEIQALTLSEIACKAELSALKCDDFFESIVEREEFERQCPTSKEPQVNGGDLGMLCLKQMFNPTIESIRGVAAFIAAGMKASADNQQKFISECLSEPSFKQRALRTIPDFSDFTTEQIAKFPCSQLVGDFQDNVARQKGYQVRDNAEAAYGKYASAALFSNDSEVEKNPFLAFLKHNKDKWKCLNQAGHYVMSCYGFFSVVDPVMLAGGVIAGAKALKLVKLFGKGSRTGELLRADQVTSGSGILSKSELASKLSPEESAAISAYSRYKSMEINKAFRSRTSLSTRTENCTYCDNIVTGLRKLPDFKGTVYRETQISNPAILKKFLTEGEVVTDRGLTSTSRKRNNTYFGEVEGPKGLSLIIRSRTGKSIESIASLPDEQEVLFLPDAKFKVVSVQAKSDGSHTVMLDQLPN